MSNRRTQNSECRSKTGPTPSSLCFLRSSLCASAFTLTEILVVITIIVLVLGMALPAFKFITGGKSEEAASNHISAMLGQARAEAIGLQKAVGVAFFVDSAGDYKMGLVTRPPIGTFPVPSPTPANGVAYKAFDSYVFYNGHAYVCIRDYTESTSNSQTPPGWGSYSTTPTVNPSTDYWAPADWANGTNSANLFDKELDTDIESLPVGIGVQLINNARFNAGARTSDGYIASGVIAFDSQGNLTSQNITFAGAGRIGQSMNLGFSKVYPDPNAVYPLGAAAKFDLASQFGLVVFQKDAFDSLTFTPQDYQTQNPSASPAPTYGSSGSGSANDEFHEEQWLDSNSTPLLINRYNGTLIKGE